MAPQAAENLRVAIMRDSARFSAHAHDPNFMPSVMGSAWIPWVRPTHSVSLNSIARRVQMRPRRRMSSVMMSIACVIW
jgi:hypothetical protein